MKIFRYTLALAMALGLRPGSAALTLYWSYRTIDSTGEIGGYSKPRFDKDDNLRVAYRGHYDMKYAELNGGKFTVQTADTGTGGAAKMDFVLDASGAPNILYQSADYKRVYHTKRTGSAWSHLLAGNTKIGNLDFYQLSLAADSKGGVHMAFAKENTGWPALYHAYLDKDGNFSDTGLVLPDLAGKWNGMVLDSKENPVIAFFKNTDELLKVAWIDSGAWKSQTVTASPQPLGYHAAIARESDTAYRLLYQDKYKKELWTAVGKPGGTWTAEKIDDLEGFTFFNSQNAVAVGADGIPYAAYAHIKSADGETVDACRLYFAYREEGEWKKVVLDSSGIVGEFAAMAVDSKGQPAVTYFDRTRHSLRVAIGSFTPVSTRRLPRLPGHRSAKPQRYDASGKKQTSGHTPGASASPARKVYFTRPDDAP